MTENNVPSTKRVRKSKKLAEKRRTAEEKKLDYLEGAVVVHKDGDLAIYRWDEEQEDLILVYRGRVG